MFEDSTFESNGTIRTRSRGWMIAASLLNGSLLLTAIAIPLVYPEALPRQYIAFLVDAPPPPASAPDPPKAPPVHAASVPTEIDERGIHAPSQIPIHISILSEPQPAVLLSSMGDWGSGTPGGLGQPQFGPSARPVVRPPTGPIHVPSSLIAGLLMRKTIPVYPPIAKVAGIEGTVVLAATISKTGTIENLRVVSGPAMLQQAALDAVKSWLYRPYLLDGEPVEVETTVNVVFSLGRQ